MAARTRTHHIAAWAAQRGLRQADIASELGADKSLVSRWFAGAVPSAAWQGKLAELFRCDSADIFRSPDEAWVANFLRGRSPDEIERIKRTLDAAFPRT